MKILKKTDLAQKREQEEAEKKKIQDLEEQNINNMLALTDIYEQLISLQTSGQ